MADEPRVNYKQLGTTGLKRYGQYVYEEFMPELRWPWAGKIYQEMADNDAVIGAILYLAEMLIRGTEWRVVPGGDAQADLDAAKFLNECMDDMDMSWADTISEVLSMITYGFSFHEIVYKIRRGPQEKSSKFKSKHSDGRVGWRRIPIRSQRTLDEWIFNEEGDVVAFVQVAEPDFKRVVIPMSKGMLFRTRVSRDNPEGKSLLRNAYRSWFFKKHFEEIEGIGIERDLAGFPVLKAPENLDLWNDEDARMVALKTRAEELVASVRRDSEEGMLLPHGWELELLTSGSSRQIDISSTIDRYDNRIAITMLSDIILIGGQKSGSFALADTKQSMLAAALQSQTENIADVFNNKAVADLFTINKFPGMTAAPRIEPGKIQTPSLKEIALVLRAMGLNIAGDKPVLDHMRNILGMPELDADLFKEEYQLQGAKAEKEAADEAAKREAAAAKEAAQAAEDKKDEAPDDTAENDLEQSDMAATGGENVD